MKEDIVLNTDKTVFILKLKRDFPAWEYEKIKKYLTEFCEKINSPNSPKNLCLVVPHDIDIRVVTIGKNKAKRKTEAKRMIRIDYGKIEKDT